MALDENILASGIESAFISVKENGEDASAAAAKIAQAVVDYAAGAEITNPAPWILTSTGAPDPSVVMSKFKVDDVTAGQSALQAAITASFTAGDSLALFAVGLIAYTAASFTSFSFGANSASGVSVMSAPPALSSAMDAGRAGGTESEVAAALAKEIHGAFTKALFNGAGSGPLSAGPVVGVFLE